MNLKTLWLHKKVISISNGYQAHPDDPSLHVGKVIDIVPVTKSQQPLPLVLFEGDQEPMMCFSTIIEYDENIYNALKKLTPKERYDLIIAICHRFVSHT